MGKPEIPISPRRSAEQKILTLRNPDGVASKKFGLACSSASIWLEPDIIITPVPWEKTFCPFLIFYHKKFWLSSTYLCTRKGIHYFHLPTRRRRENYTLGVGGVGIAIAQAHISICNHNANQPRVLSYCNSRALSATSQILLIFLGECTCWLG